MGAQHRWDTLPTQVAESGKNGPAEDLEESSDMLSSAYDVTVVPELTVAVVT